MDNFMDKLAQRYNAQEMIMANAQAEAAKMQDLQEQVEAYEAVLQEMRKLNYKNTELTEKMYSLVDESIEKVRTLQLEAVEGTASTEMVTREMSDAVMKALNEALNNMDATVARTLSEALAATLTQPTEELKQSTELVGSSVQGMKDAILKIDLSAEALAASASEVRNSAAMVCGSMEEYKMSAVSMQEDMQGIRTGVESIQGMRTGIESMQEDMQGIRAGVESIQEMRTGIESMREDMQGIRAGVESIQEMRTGMGSMQENMQGIHKDLREGMGDLYTSINGIQASIANFAEVAVQPQDIQAVESEELRHNISELSSTMEDIHTGIRNLKSSSDDVKTSFKTALEAGIYGLKQDNREIVEFMQRMNASLTAKKVDPEQERKEAEAKEKEEADKQALEERFKAVEDFMHKESVKVYRNVQAVVNEKIDRQAEGNENRSKQTASQIKQVKTVAVMAVVLSVINIILSVLGILGII